MWIQTLIDIAAVVRQSNLCLKVYIASRRPYRSSSLIHGSLEATLSHNWKPNIYLGGVFSGLRCAVIVQGCFGKDGTSDGLYAGQDNDDIFSYQSLNRWLNYSDGTNFKSNKLLENGAVGRILSTRKNVSIK